MTSNFKVVVVGGGPVGLTAAHALTHAGIDFTLLERRESAIIDAGSNLVINQQGLRALSQLNLLDALEEVSSSCENITRQDHAGKDIGKMHWFKFTKDLFGAFPRVVSRHDLTKVLYENLPKESQDKVHVNKKVTAIDSTDAGVRVSCADGTSYDASLIIAADGAHSMVRNCMRDLALASGSDEVNEERPFLTTYRCLWIRFPTAAFPEISAGMTSETHGKGASTQLFAGEKTGVTGIYERMAEPTKERLRYTQEDQDALIERWGHLPLTNSGKMTLRSAYESRLQAGLVSLEEGVVENWSWDGRVVLAGDAAHKYTPSTGAGCNTGIIDIVALVNELHKITITTPAPTKSEVDVALKAYRDARYNPVVGGYKAANAVTAMSTWENGKMKFMDKHVLAVRPVQKWMNGQNAANIAQTPAFTFIKGEERLVGTMPWVNAIAA